MASHIAQLLSAVAAIFFLPISDEIRDRPAALVAAWFEAKAGNGEAAGLGIDRRIADRAGDTA
jgi:hydroxylamine reductase (hybrid-cluster protein)